MKSLLLALSVLLVASADGATRVIVEFHGAPAAVAGPGVAAAHRQTHERFRLDLGRTISTQYDARQRPRIRHEYSTVFFGAAIDLEPADIARLRELPYVRAVHPDRDVRTCATASEVVDARARVNASALPASGKGMVIAIIDTGIDYLHPDLGGGFGPGFKVAGGYDFLNDDADPRDDHGHGTHVAGIAAANGSALIGVAPEATLIAYKVLNAFGGGTEGDVIAAIERSADPNGDGDLSDRHDVINMSLGAQGMADDPMARASDNATAAGVIVVVAAGNSGTSIVSVNSPGTSRAAITVGAHDSAGVVAEFSSRGPTPGLLTFKPDVVAPGVGILSSKMGGGLVAHAGTSMAAPHVAGICALLRALHPDWTPADVKAALASSALAVDATAYVRGAGRVDAQRAHEAKVLVRTAGLSFGLAPSAVGALEATQAFVIENRSAVEQTFELVPPSVPSGIKLTVVPATFALRPAETRSIAVRLAIDNAAVPFADDEDQRLLGGTIVFTGSTPVTVPWGIVRSARITVQADTGVSVGEAFESGQPFSFSRFFTPYGPTQMEMFVKPGGTWDLVASTFDTVPNPESLRLTIIENRSATDDELVVIRSEDAPLRIAFDGRDVTGAPIRSRPAGPLAMRHLTVTWTREVAHGVDRNDYRSAKLSDVYVSPASTRFSLSALETLIDLDAMEAYNVQHETLRGLSESKTLTRHASSLIHTRLELEPLGTSVAVCTVAADFTFGTRCVERRARPAGTLDYFTTEGEPLKVSGIQIRTSHLTTPTLRGYEGGVIGTWDATPPAATLRIPKGGTAVIGAGPVYPYAIPGTTGITPFQVRPGFRGALDDDRGTVNTYLSDGSIGAPPKPVPGGRYVVTREGLLAAGHVSRGVLEVSFGSNADDLEPPSLTSLRIVDHGGRNIDRLTRGAAATLRLSAADFDYRKAMETKVWRPEATRAWIRQTGTIDWRPLTLVFEGADLGNANTLRHVPSGDLFRADLSSITSGAEALYDLRIDVEDAAGNRATWTQSPAFSVGTVAAPPRRRSVNR